MYACHCIVLEKYLITYVIPSLVIHAEEINISMLNTYSLQIAGT
jgi:hypothetical protein